jgi:hypothetical protein
MKSSNRVAGVDKCRLFHNYRVWGRKEYIWAEWLPLHWTGISYPVYQDKLKCKRCGKRKLGWQHKDYNAIDGWETYISREEYKSIKRQNHES